MYFRETIFLITKSSGHFLIRPTYEGLLFNSDISLRVEDRTIINGEKLTENILLKTKGDNLKSPLDSSMIRLKM